MSQKMQQDSANLWEYIDFVKPQIEESLRKFSQQESVDENVSLAFDHALLFGSDRLRAILTLLTAELIGGRAEKVFPAATSLEYIYASFVVLENLILKDEFYQKERFSPLKLANGRLFSMFICLHLMNIAYNLVFVNHRFEPEKALEAHNEIVECVSSVKKFAEKIYDSKEDCIETKGFRDVFSALLIRLSIRVGAILEGADYVQLSVLSRFAENFSQAYLLSEEVIKQKGKERALKKRLEEIVHEASRILVENFPPSQARSKLVQLVEYLKERKV